MTADPRILDLILRWEEERGRGRFLTPEELCRDCPELVDSIREHLVGLVGPDVLQGTGPMTTPPLSGFPAAAVPPRPAGPRFVPLHLHARGGLGAVYLAHDAELNRDVALKQMQAHLADLADLRRRFLLEAEVTGRLEHPGIVPVYGLGVDENGRPYYAMRFIQGDSLQQAISRFHSGAAGERALALRGLLRRFVDVCNTIAYAHSHGVIHRDIKPANVMLGPYGETLVVDWGLARRAGAASPLSESPASDSELPQGADAPRSPGPTQGAVGTPPYMAPEQAAGQQERVGPASDVYSLGATLYHLLTGQPPFERAPLNVLLEKVQRGEVVPPRQRRPGVPPALEAVCLKAMSLRPEDRYAGAADLAADVERWLADEPVTACREPWRDRARRWLARHRTAVLATLAGGAVALVALAVSTVLLQQANEAERSARGEAEQNAATAKREQQAAEQARDQARTAQGREKTARIAAELSEKATRENLYVSKVSLAWQAWQDGQVSRARQFLRDVLPRPGEEDLRGFEWRLLWRLCHAPGARRLRGHTRLVSGLAFSPDGKLLASGSDDGTVMLWEPGTGRPLAVLPPDPESSAGELGVAWQARDGKVLVAGVLPLGAAAADLRLRAGDELLAISGPDGKLIPAAGLSVEAVRKREVGPPGTAVTVQVRTRSGLHRCTLARRVLYPARGSSLSRHRSLHVAFSPDGKLLASATGTVVRLWDVHSRQARHTLKHTGQAAPLTALAFSPDGKLLAVGDESSRIRLWDVAAGKPAGTLVPRAPGVGMGRAHALAFSPDGKALLVSAGSHLFRFDVAGRSQVEMVFDRGKAASCLAWLADGTGFALGRYGGRDNIELWDAAPLQRRAYLPGHTDWVRALSLAPDGQVLASAASDHTVRLWGPAVGKALATLRGHAGAVEAVACGPNGLLASADHEGLILVWDIGEQVRGNVLAFRTRSEVKDLVVGPDNTTLVGVTGSGPADLGGVVEAWDLRSRRSRGLLHGPPPWLRDLEFSPDGKTLAVTTTPGPDTAAAGECRLLDVATGRQRLWLGDFPAAVGVAWSGDGSVLIAGSGDFAADEPGEVRFLDARTGRTLRRLQPHRGVCGVRSSGKALLTFGVQYRPIGRRAVLAWWGARTGQPLGRLEGDFARLKSADLSRDGKLLAVALGDLNRPDLPAEVKLLDAGSGKELARLAGHTGFVGSIGFAPDDHLLATAGWDGMLRLFEVPSGKPLPTLPRQPGAVLSLSFSADGKRLAAGIVRGSDPPGSKPGLARVWDLPSRKQIAGFTLPAGSAPRVALSPDGRLLAAGNTRAGVALWDVETGKQRLLQPGSEQPPAGPARPATCLALSPDGKTLATGGYDQQVSLWALDGPAGNPGRLRKTVPAGEVVSALAFSGDGRTLAIGTGGRMEVQGRGQLRLYDLRDGKVHTRLRIGTAGVSALALLPDGRTLAVATDHFRRTRAPSEVFLVDLSTGRRGRTVHRGNFITRCLAASPDGKMLAFDLASGGVLLVERATGKVRQLPGHVHLLYRLAFAPDGRTLASASADGTVKLWHLATGREMLSLPHEHWVEGLCFSPDGRLLLSGSQTNLRGTAHVWDASPVALQAQTWYDPAEAGFARVVQTDDEHGRLVEVRFLGPDGRPAAGPFGQARTVIERGKDGKETGRSFFDVRGRALRPQVEVLRVLPGGQGEKLGLRAGDVLLRYDGRQVRSTAGFITARQGEKPGESARPLVIRRDGVERTVQVSPGLLGVELRQRLVPPAGST